MSHPESSDDGSPSPPLRRQRHQFFYDYIRERDAVVIERVPSSEQLEDLDPLAQLWHHNSDKTYTHRDVNLLYDELAPLFADYDQLLSAQGVYMDAVRKPGASPVTAFRQAAMASPIAQELDSRRAHDGGLFAHLQFKLEHHFVCTRFGPGFSSDLKKDFGDARALRKIQDIKKLMPASQKKDEEVQLKARFFVGPGSHPHEATWNGVKWEIKHEVMDEVMDKDGVVDGDGIKFMVKDEGKDEVKDEVKDEGKDEGKDEVKDVDEAMTEMRLSNGWVIIDPEDADTPESG